MAKEHQKNEPVGDEPVVLEQEEENTGIISNYKTQHEAVSGEGRVHPGIVQPDELQRDPKMHEQPIF